MTTTTTKHKKNIDESSRIQCKSVFDFCDSFRTTKLLPLSRAMTLTNSIGNFLAIFFLFSYGANARTLLHNDSTTSRKACNRDMKIAESCSRNVRDPYRTVLIRWRFQPLSQMSHLQQQKPSEQFVQWPKLSAWCRNYRPMSIDQNCTLLSRVRIETTVWEARLGIWKIWNYRWQ